MPSPVIGLTSPAASPASSTRPLGSALRAVDSGSWWPTQSVAPCGRAGQQRLELLDQVRAAGSGASWVEQLAVPDVGEAVAAVEGPGVRRLPAVAEDDDLRAAAASGGSGRSRGSPRPSGRRPDPSDRGGRRSARRPRRRRPGRRAARRGSPLSDGADPVPHQLRSGRCARLDQPVVKTVRGTTQAGRRISRSTTRRRGSAAAGGPAPAVDEPCDAGFARAGR